MSILTDIFAFIGSFVLSIISQLGYAGIFFLMMLESMIVPVPSEFVMPFAGFLVAQGSFNVVLVILVSTLGSITGSLLFYYIGTTGGLTLVQRYGKYVLVDTEDIKKTEAWFNKRGDLTIFLARLIPVVRHLISLIAGIAKMNVKKFTIYTIFGAALWNGILTYLGLFLGQHWDKVSQYMENLDLVIVILLIAGCLYFVYRHLRRAKKKAHNNKTGYCFLFNVRIERTNGMSKTRFPPSRSKLRNNSPSYSEELLRNPFVYHSNKNTTETMIGTSRSNGANHNSNRNNNL